MGREVGIPTEADHDFATVAEAVNELAIKAGRIVCALIQEIGRKRRPAQTEHLPDRYERRNPAVAYRDYYALRRALCHWSKLLYGDPLDYCFRVHDVVIDDNCKKLTRVVELVRLEDLQDGLNLGHAGIFET